MSDVTLKTLLDRMEITDTVIRYGTSIDLRDWARFRTCFADEIEVDFTSWGGGRDLSLFPAPKRMKAEQWVAGVSKSLSGFTATQHLLANHTIDLQGDRAECLSYVQAMHYLPNDRGDNELVLGGYYNDRMVRTAQGWRIEGLKLTVLWTKGNRFVFELAFAKS
jgi:hypothetical protein